MEAPLENSTASGSRTHSPGRPSPPPFGFGKASDQLGAWSFYFIAKLVLFWRDLIGLHPIENLAFVLVLAVPLASPRWRRLRRWLAAPAAVALLYYDSWLPPIARVVSQAGMLSGFSLGYLMELAGRFVSWPIVAMLIIAAVLYFIVARFVRIDVFVVVALLVLAIFQAIERPQGGVTASAVVAGGDAAAKDPETQLKEFFDKEAQRTVKFARPPAGSVPFDVIFIHVCSLSWDDLEATGLDQHPLLKSFDLVLRRFNSAASYSGPAVIRLLRGGCGQTSHRALYSPAPDRCLLMTALHKAGFETFLMLNHDGHYADFLATVKDQGVAVAPMPLDGIAVTQRAFDQSRIHEDRDVLSRWMATREKSGAPRVATYYNTISLHDGNRLVADATKSSLETYRPRLGRLLDDLDGFMKRLESGGRRTVVVMVPEHGAAVRGDATQIAGLREIPSPAITLVPVGIKVIGPDARRIGESLQLTESTSYLALAHIISVMLDKSPYGAGGFRPADYTTGMPVTELVSENEGTAILRRGDKYFLRQGEEAWKEYSVSPGR